MTKCSQCETDMTAKDGNAGSICGPCMGPPCYQRHYVAVLEKSVLIGWPATFVTDLLCHDKRTLSTRPNALPFLWCVRETGTYLVLPEDGRMARDSSVLDDGHKMYWWDGETLSAVTRGQAMDKLEAFRVARDIAANI